MPLQLNGFELAIFELIGLGMQVKCPMAAPLLRPRVKTYPQAGTDNRQTWAYIEEWTRKQQTTVPH